MAGPSYLSWSQTQGVARGDAAVPDALVPTFAPFSGWPRGFVSYGALSLFLTFWWYAFDAATRSNLSSTFMNMFDVEEALRRLPLETLDESTAGLVSPMWREHVAHPTCDDYWKPMDLTGRLDRFTMPTLQVAGWYDYYPAQQLKVWQRLRAVARTPQIAAGHKIIIGPWGHNHGLENTPGGNLAADFGPAGRFNHRAIYRAWFDRQFKGIMPADGLGEKPVRLFVMGVNQWRDEDQWPLSRTRYTPYFLHSAGQANSRRGDGNLRLEAPAADQPPDRYDYDPDRPVMTRGGNHSIGPWNDAYKRLIWCGPCDQGPTEDRGDVLVYTAAPLEANLEVTGPVTLQLWAASSTPDTDWVARLVDVHPDGQAINLTEGNLRARFRSYDWSRPQLIAPGEVS